MMDRQVRSLKCADAHMKNGTGLYKPTARTVNLRLRG